MTFVFNGNKSNARPKDAGIVATTNTVQQIECNVTLAIDIHSESSSSLHRYLD